MSEGLQYQTEGLEAKARICETPRPAVPGDAKAPDMLLSTFGAWSQLNASAATLISTLEAGDREGQRIAAAIRAAAVAYNKMDEANSTSLSGQMNGGGAPPAGETAVPDMAGIPGSLPIESAAGGYPSSANADADEGDWQEAARTIHTGADVQALSMKFFRDQWRDYQSVLEGHGRNFTQPAEGWHGAAAETCAEAQRRLSTWWADMGAECGRLAQEATTFVDAHDKLVATHPTLAEVEAFNNTDWSQYSEMIKQSVWQEYQDRSDDALEAYANGIHMREIRPGKPPAIGGLPAVHDGEATGVPGTPGGPGGPGGGPGGGGGTPEMPKTPEVPSMSPASMDPAAGEQPSGSPGGGSPSGGSPSGGSPGGGAPSGGSPSGAPTGMPEGPATDVPGLDEPTLSPASAGGGGGAPGGGGGDIPKTPLAPAVGAENVAPTKGGPGIPTGAPGAPGAAGGMGGGMGGMGGGHGQGGQGNEKRRNPKLAPDEELYKEDRAWTEAVIGNRRRSDVKDTNK